MAHIHIKCTHMNKFEILKVHKSCLEVTWPGDEVACHVSLSFPILKFEIILGKWPGDEANNLWVRGGVMGEESGS